MSRTRRAPIRSDVGQTYPAGVTIQMQVPTASRTRVITADEVMVALAWWSHLGCPPAPPKEAP